MGSEKQEVERKAKAFKREQIEKKRAEQVQLIGAIYVKLFASHTCTIEETKVFEQEQRNRELEEEVEATLNFLSRTITSIVKPTPQIIVILDSKEEMEIRPQPIVKEQLQLVFAPRLVGKGESQ